MAIINLWHDCKVTSSSSRKLCFNTSVLCEPYAPRLTRPTVAKKREVISLQHRAACSLFNLGRVGGRRWSTVLEK